MLSLAPAFGLWFSAAKSAGRKRDKCGECSLTFFEFFCEGSSVFFAKGRAATESWSSDASPSDSSSSFRSASNSRYLREPGGGIVSRC